MTTDKIEPALTPDEWRGGEAAWPTVSLATTTHGPLHVWDGKDTDDSHSVTVAPSDLPALIALANAALPDTDPRKITREDVVQLRLVVNELIGKAPEAMRRVLRLAAALESYLPPE